VLCCAQVRPNVHAAFHDRVDRELAALADAKDAPVRKRKSDARIIAAICAEMEALCGDPNTQAAAAEEFQKYQEVRASALRRCTALAASLACHRGGAVLAARA
jgi:hypothetical protein